MSAKKGNGKGTEINHEDIESNANKVIDFTKVRAERMEEKQRKYERVFLRNLMSVYSSAGSGHRDGELIAIEVVEVSEDGCQFLVEPKAHQIWPGTLNIPIRFYFSQDTFLEVQAKIVWSNPAVENGRRYVRYGCSIDTQTKSYDAYRAFVTFIKQYSEHAHRDLGKVSTFYS
jgi:hypothetical protein